MPRRDGTGPDGRGPKTGRGLGYCNGQDSPGHFRGERAYCGRGMRNGRRNRNRIN